MNNEPVVPFGWFWFESEENKSPYTQITGYTYERFSTMKPDGSAKIDEGSLIPLYTHQYERPHNTVLVPCDKLAEMQAEIEALKGGFFDWSGFKELTDEEIIKVYENMFGVAFARSSAIDFARAILKKAQEK